MMLACPIVDRQVFWGDTDDGRFDEVVGSSLGWFRFRFGSIARSGLAEFEPNSAMPSER